MPADPLTEATKRPPKTAKGKRVLKKRESQVVEDAKTALILRGNKATQECVSLLRDLFLVRTPLATLFMRKHAEHPFEDMTKVTGLCTKSDHNMFAFGSSSKKRPFRLILGRLFMKELLDMQEFGVKDYRSIHSFRASKAAKDVVAGSKPLVLFQGTAFEADESMKRAKSLLLDYFSGPRPDHVLLEGIDSAIVCSVVDSPSTGSASGSSTGHAGGSPLAVTVRRYKISMMKSGTKLPRAELEEIGPRFTLTLDRSKEPDKERWKYAIKVPKAAKVKVEKNVKKNSMGKSTGRIHLGKNNYDQIHTVHHGLSKNKELKAALAKTPLAKDKKK